MLFCNFHEKWECDINFFQTKVCICNHFRLRSNKLKDLRLCLLSSKYLEFNNFRVNSNKLNHFYVDTQVRLRRSIWWSADVRGMQRHACIWNETEMKLKGDWKEIERKQKEFWSSPKTVLNELRKRTETGQRDNLLLANQSASFTVLSRALSRLWKSNETTTKQQPRKIADWQPAACFFLHLFQICAGHVSVLFQSSFRIL